jgi:hypothetical protein
MERRPFAAGAMRECFALKKLSTFSSSVYMDWRKAPNVSENHKGLMLLLPGISPTRGARGGGSVCECFAPERLNTFISLLVYMDWRHAPSVSA